MSQTRTRNIVVDAFEVTTLNIGLGHISRLLKIHKPMRKQTARNMSTIEMFTVEWQPISTGISLDQGPCNIHRPL